MQVNKSKILKKKLTKKKLRKINRRAKSIMRYRRNNKNINKKLKKQWIK